MRSSRSSWRGCDPGSPRHTVAADLPADLPDVSVDPVQLDQVLTNLLENAGRHAPEGSEIRVSVRVDPRRRPGPGRGRGPGDPGDERERVFEAFYRGSSSPETPGSGLGLAISKAVVVAHGGRIWIESGRGGGCVVAFEIPREEGGSVNRVLVVDDEPQIRRALRTSLEAHGYEVQTVGTGEEAVIGAAESAPELMLLDLGLPDLDGTEVIRRVRGFTELPIIVLSVRDAQQDKVAALDAGADDYVTKPFAMEELLARARAAMRRAQPGEPPAPTMRFGTLEMDLGRRLVILDGETLRLTPTEYQLLEAFATHPGKLLTHQWLLRKVWGQGYGTETTYLRTYVRALRKKLGDDAQAPQLIVTEPGVGYRWIAESTDAES